VLFIGGSFTVGHGVAFDEAFTRRLEAARPDLLCQTYALNGSGNGQQMLFHNYFAPQIDPDVLVLSPYTGCVGRTVLRERNLFDSLQDRRVDRPKPYFVIDEDDVLLIGNVAVPSMVDHLVGKERPQPVPFEIKPGRPLEACASLEAETSDNVAAVPEPHHTPSYGIYSNPDGVHYRTAQKVLLRTIESSSARRRILMPLPHQMNLPHPEEDYRHFYRQIAAESGCEFVDLLPAFEPWRKVGFDCLYIQGDGYFTPEANRIFANKLAEVL
jgi:hypothetical protein